MALPCPVDLSTASGASLCAAQLDRVKQALPEISVVYIGFDMDTSTRDDWLAILDLCSARQLRAVVMFGKPTTGTDLFRPTFDRGAWQFGKMGEFVADASTVNHPALLAVYTIDEPWHGEKRPAYSADDLKAVYAALKAKAPAGASFNILVQFSREIWKYIHDKPQAGAVWDAGMCDIVQIAGLELQDGQYQETQLESNHFWSRKIVHEKTPDIPLWTSAQAFGSGYGPGAGYWFPRERDGHDDLTTLLDDLTAAKLEEEHPLAGIMLQMWDSPASSRRAAQYTLGDEDRAGTPVSQLDAAADAVAAVIAWLARQ